MSREHDFDNLDILAIKFDRNVTVKEKGLIKLLRVSMLGKPHSHIDLNSKFPVASN